MDRRDVHDVQSRPPRRDARRRSRRSKRDHAPLPDAPAPQSQTPPETRRAMASIPLRRRLVPMAQPRYHATRRQNPNPKKTHQTSEDDQTNQATLSSTIVPPPCLPSQKIGLGAPFL